MLCYKGFILYATGYPMGTYYMLQWYGKGTYYMLQGCGKGAARVDTVCIQGYGKDMARIFTTYHKGMATVQLYLLEYVTVCHKGLASRCSTCYKCVWNVVAPSIACFWAVCWTAMLASAIIEGHDARSPDVPYQSSKQYQRTHSGQGEGALAWMHRQTIPLASANSKPASH